MGVHMILHQLFVSLIAKSASHVHDRKVGDGVTRVVGGLVAEIDDFLVGAFFEGVTGAGALVEVGIVALVVGEDGVALFKKLL